MNRVDEIYNLKYDLDREIYSIQNLCQHEEYNIGLYFKTMNGLGLKKYCTKCSLILGDPIQEEINDYNHEMKDELIIFSKGTKIYKNK